MIEHMEEVINRELTPKEKRFVEWLSGWGTETIDIFNGLLDTFYKAGQADTLEQQQREIDRLREALKIARNNMEDALSVGEVRHTFDPTLMPWCNLIDGVKDIEAALSPKEEEQTDVQDNR